MNADCLQVNDSRKHATFADQKRRPTRKRLTPGNLKSVPLNALVDDFAVKKDSFKLIAQTQEELLREFRRKASKKSASHRNFNRQPRSGPIKPINVHLLTGSSLKNSCSVAELVSEKFIGRSAYKKHLETNRDKYPKRSSRPYLVHLETLRNEIAQTDIKPINSIIHCKQFRELEGDTQSQALFRTPKPDIGRYKPWSRFLWFIHPNCEPYTESKTNKQESEFSETNPTRIRKTGDQQRKPSLLSQRSSFSMSKRSSSHLKFSTFEIDAENPEDEQNDDKNVESADSESSEPKEVEAEPSIHLMATENDYIESFNPEHTASFETDAAWNRSSESPQRAWKTDQCTTTHRMSSPNPYADHLLRSQSVYQYDKNAVIMASLPSGNKRTIRHLLCGLSEECTPRLIYQRYRRNGRIVFNADEYAASYGPQILQTLKNRWYNMLGSSKPVINDNLIMRLLQKRLDEMRRSDLTKMEHDLQIKESQRFQHLLLNHIGDQQLVKIELLKEGELCHRRRRHDPVILQRGQLNQPVFGLNPMKELYRASHRDPVEVPAGNIQKPVDEEVKTSIQQYNRKKTGKNKKLHKQSKKPTKSMQFHPLDLREKDLHSNKQSWHLYDGDMVSPYFGEGLPEVSSTVEGSYDVAFDQNVPHLEREGSHKLCLVRKLPITPVSVESCLLTTNDSGELDSGNNGKVMKMYTAAKRLLNLGTSTEEESKLPHFVTADSQATMQGIDVSLLE